MPGREEQAPEDERAPDDGREDFAACQARRLRESRSGCLLAVGFLPAWFAAAIGLRALDAGGTTRRVALAASCVAFIVWMARRDARGVQHGVVWLFQLAAAIGVLIASMAV